MNVNLQTPSTAASNVLGSSQPCLPQNTIAEERHFRITQIKDKVLETIRDRMPISTLFQPEIKINLDTFINNQVLIQKIATHLAPLTDKGRVDSQTIAKHLEESNLFSEIKQFCETGSKLTLLYEACADVINKETFSHELQPAIEGRIFTLKNAFIAQQTPQEIRKSQIANKLSPHNLKQIQEEGKVFIRESLRIHLQALNQTETSSFKEHLTSTAEQLVPFVQKMTRNYLRENGKDCPDNPLTFRNPIGYNHHGLTAATIMEACLNVLGYETRIMGRMDLEPKVTLATAHNIVEVTAPDGTRYVIDPSYIQFHKDICSDDALLPKTPVLVLQESEVDTYIEDHLMNQWKAHAEMFKKDRFSTHKRLEQRNQDIPFIIREINLPPEAVPLNPEDWVRKSLKRVWDLRTYAPVLTNQGFEDIFIGNQQKPKTHEVIKAMNIASLCYHPSFVKTEERLKTLLNDPTLKSQNSLEALALISQLPISKRDPYISLLDCDSRIESFNKSINAYFRSLKKIVNLEGKDKSVIYGCSGADCTSVMLATDAQDFTFVDLTPAFYEEFQQALAQLKALGSLEDERKLKIQLEQSTQFMTRRFLVGGSSSAMSTNTHVMHDLALKLLFDLRETGVDLNTLTLSRNQDETGVRIEFLWQYQGAPSPRKRSITFLTADITKPQTYTKILKTKLEEGFDIFYMKAAFLAPRAYPQFLPAIANSVKESGWLMTTDKTFDMDEFKPDECLDKSHLTFISQKNEEVSKLEEIIHVSVNPLGTIPVIQQIPIENRVQRAVGSDITYWSRLNLRQKSSHIS